ncbi:hypothetical protein CR492_18635 [Methylocella silvestris]|uniref:Uncharacterized protein n=1 Tax=Methylocella silvestris TaxID=199596 RepID=A0A2J7TCF4_METSI|nr:hypothetical protein CR492_18635 [Methylocella silvestris]
MAADKGARAQPLFAAPAKRGAFGLRSAFLAAWLTAIAAALCSGETQASGLQRNGAVACGRHLRACNDPLDANRWAETPPHLRPCFSRDDCDRKAFDESGTRGRMGLGADPAHPEGPGNFSD